MFFVTTQYNEKVIDTKKSWNYLIDRRWKEISINNIQILFNKKYEMDTQEYFIEEISKILPKQISENLAYL